MKIYITRHGESVGNVKGYIAYPHTKLTAKGIRNAQALGKRFTQECHHIDAIYCSNLYRAQQTLDQFLKKYKNIQPNKIFVTELLNEIGRQEYNGRPSSEYYRDRDSSGVDSNLFRCKGGENEIDVKNRAITFKKLIETHGYENILIISHGHLLSHFCCLYGVDYTTHLQGATFSLIEVSSNKTQVLAWNDSLHLI